MSKIPSSIVARLFDALSEDDAFRAAFEADPRAALSGLGYETPERDVGVEGRDPVLPFLDLRGGLASKDKIRAGRDRLQRSYDTATVTSVKGQAFGPFDLCAE
jgi:putative modified peptide